MLHVLSMHHFLNSFKIEIRHIKIATIIDCFIASVFVFLFFGLRQTSETHAIFSEHGLNRT